MTNGVGGSWIFDAERANDEIQKIESFIGKDMEIIPYQREVFNKWFGTINPVTNSQRYSELFLFIPSQNGKTTLAAMFALHALLDPTEKNTKVLVAAPTKGQSSPIYDIIMTWVDADSWLSGFLKPDANKQSLLNTVTNVQLMSLSGKSNFAEGKTASACIVDELHAFKDNGKLYNTVKTRLKSRGDGKKSTFIVLTTASGNPSDTDLCFSEYTYACKVRDEIFNYPYLLPVIYQAKKDEDPFDMEVCKRCNPGMGYGAVTFESMEKDIAKSRDSLNELRRHRRYGLNQFVEPDSAYINLDSWRECGLAAFDINQYAGQEIYLGLDYGASYDLTAIVWLIPKGTHDKREWIVHSHFFMPAALAAIKETTDGTPYREWAEAGHLTLTDGSQTDYETLHQYVKDQAKKFKVRILGFDPFNLAQTVQTFKAAGIKVGEAQMKGYWLSGSLKQIDICISNKTLRHSNNPVMNWNASNARLEMGKDKDRMKLIKAEGTQKIDGISALACAMQAATSEVIPERKPLPKIESLWIRK